MRELIVPPLIINLMMFLVGSVLGIAPGLVTVSSAGGYVFQLGINTLIFSLIAALIGLVSIIGIKILGSGLDSQAVGSIRRAVAYSITWTLLSSVTFTFLYELPTFGAIIYAAMSILFGIGVFLSIGEDSSGVGGGGGQSKQIGASEG